MAGFVCLYTGTPHCYNCGDSSWWYRDEQPVFNEAGQPFCDYDCANEWDERREAEEIERSTNWCAVCGFDNHEHAPGCINELRDMLERV